MSATPATSSRRVNRLTPLRFVMVFGLLSGLGDIVYEGARSMTGPFLASFGASAALVGFISGAGEAVALVLRLPFGLLSDRTGRPWPITIVGYTITMVAAPLLAVAWAIWPAAALAVLERFGKAVRTPARDTMLAQASVDLGRGRAFAIHEALDQTGALVGPLLVAAAIATLGSMRWGFAVLAAPAVAALAVLAYLRRAVPVPAAYEPHESHRSRQPLTAPLPRTFWLYAGYTAINMLGFATWAVFAYHLATRDVVATPTIAVMYALAMGCAAVGALASGWAYDRIGLRGLVVVPALTAIVPFLAFSTTPAVVWGGAALWGISLGIHESTMRAAVADLVPAHRRGAGYGTFTAVYGLAWLAGSTIVGASYARSVGTAEAFITATQVAALIAFVPVLRAVRRP
ncbi:MAG TPA: MFS transporter [Solirubrobacteraceae bacterium]|nr:MFS transporter [Solirubrobacteraceae bacterium]